MRISDWSSDVCSSDLTVPTDLEKVPTTKSISSSQPSSSNTPRPFLPKKPMPWASSHRIIVLGCFFTAATMAGRGAIRSEEHTSELQSLMRISYAVFCLKKKNNINVKINIQEIQKQK